MNKILCLFFLIVSIWSCSSQNTVVKNISKNVDLNYVLSNILTDKIIRKELRNRGQFVTVFEISDSKATPGNFSEGSEELLSSYIVSISPDGDYYTNSKLYKIEGLYMPNIIEIKETIYPEFSVTIEHGIYNKRRTDVFKLKGVN
jgi:hypothetical protein